MRLVHEAAWQGACPWWLATPVLNVLRDLQVERCIERMERAAQVVA